MSIAAASLRSLARRRPRLRLPAAPLVVPGGRAALLSGAAEEAAPLAATEAAAAPPVPGRKVLESFHEEFEIGGRSIAFETGKMARFANGSVVISMEDTHVLSTVAAAKSSEPIRDFLPLTTMTPFRVSRVVAIADQTIGESSLIDETEDINMGNGLDQYNEPIRTRFCNHDKQIEQAYDVLLNSSKQTLSSMMDLQKALLESNQPTKGANEIPSASNGVNDEWSKV